ncbi:MAG: AAA family ATPase [Blastocatellia bacterium]|nr:AAA family ATPase [Blastocatellia bacterium]
MAQNTRTLTLSKSEPQQTGLMGYVITDAKVYETVKTTMAVAGNFGWLLPHHTMIWNAIEAYHKEFEDRHPTVAEIESSDEVLRHDRKMQDRLKHEIKKAVDARVDFGYLALESDLREWQRDVVVEKALREIVQLHNANDGEAARKCLISAGVRLETLSNGLTDKFRAAPDVMKTENAERLEQASRRISYGISYLDEALGGIAPNDVILIGAKSGVGKTELATRIALANAERTKLNLHPKRVAFFALEAEPAEIERRIKYSLLIKAYYDKYPDERRWEKDEALLSYKAWRLGIAQSVFGEFEDEVQARCDVTLPYLQTYYRQYGDFGIEELEKGIVKVAKNADLIILDHLHFMDLPSDNENAAYKDIVKRIRHLALQFGKPIIVIAHLRKSGPPNRYNPIMPNLDDFHGSSDIVKIATAAILLGNAKNHVKPCLETYQGYNPTFIRIAKSRIDGSLVHGTGVAYYDFIKRAYKKEYSFGTLINGDTEWRPTDPRQMPVWAVNGTIDAEKIDREGNVVKAKKETVDR